MRRTASSHTSTAAGGRPPGLSQSTGSSARRTDHGGTSPSFELKQTFLPPGAEVDHFQIRSLLAKGGMGEVYVAWDQKLDREVALKVIRGRYRLDPCAKERFLREAKALSQLEHPAISRIYDYVEGKDTDYIVLELIRGRDLLEALESGLDHGVKLRLAQEIAEVLVAAHSKGIIHRDLKPENVMLTAENRVKVLDFGLAKTVPEAETSSVVVMTQRRSRRRPARETVSAVSSDTTTRVGEIVGTPAYMSPEQAKGDRATPASDMFSFGLVLQHLLTGKPPYDLDQGQERILSRARKAHTRPCAGLDPDLAALVDRLKSAAPGARPSALDTVERLLSIRDKPRRRRRQLLMTSAAAAVVIFAVAMTAQTFRIAQERDRANREAEVSREVSDFLVDLFEVSDPDNAQGSTVTARELLDQGAERLESGELQDPAIQVRMMGTVGRIYQRLGLYEDSAGQLERALEQAERLNGEGENLRAGLHHELGKLLWRTGDYERGEQELETAVALRRQTLGDAHPDVAESLMSLAGIYYSRGQYGSAQALCEQSLAIWEGVGDPRTTQALSNLALLHFERGRFGVAEPLFRRLQEALETTLGASHPELGRNSMNLGLLLVERGKLAEAEPFLSRAVEIYQTVFDGQHQRTAQALNNLASLYLDQNRLREAEALAERAGLAISAAVGQEHLLAASNFSLLSGIYGQQGRHTEAEKAGKRALELQERLVGRDHPKLAVTLHRLALLHRQQGRSAEAEGEILRALSIRRTALGKSHPYVALSLHELAVLHREQGRLDEAVAAEEEALAIGEARLTADHPALAESRDHLSQLRHELVARR